MSKPLEQRLRDGDLDPLAAQHLVEMRESPLMRPWMDLRNRAEMVAYMELELVEALHSLDPQAPGNGRDMNPFHAGCCVLRAYGVLRRLRDSLKTDAVEAAL